MALYRLQASDGENTGPSPRTVLVKQLIENEATKTRHHRRVNNVDRGVGTLLEGYQTTEEFERIADAFLSLGDIRGRTAFMVSHYGLLRGQNVRELEFADMFSQALEGEGFQDCVALVLLIEQSKANVHGKAQHVGFLRNKNVSLCPVGAVAMYFFELFHVRCEPFPSLVRAEDWYGVKFLRGRDRKKAITYHTQRASYLKAFGTLGLAFSKVTHIGRQQGVRQLEAADVDISQTRRHGHWGLDVCEAVYSAPLAREAMRTFSGHPPKARMYYLQRAELEPPPSLAHRVFSDIESSLQRVVSGECENPLAARGFLELLRYLRVVLLQDSAFLYDQLPARVRDQDIFGEEFQAYRREVLNHATISSDPAEKQLAVAMPLLDQQLTAQHEVVATQLALQNDRITKLTAQVGQLQQQLKSALKGTHRIQTIPAALDASGDRTPVVCETNPSAPSSVTPPSDLSYTMSDSIESVAELWTAWHDGINGGPSIQHLERTYGTKWRSTPGKMKYFSRRNAIIRLVKSLAEGGLSVDDAIVKADKQRDGRSMDAFAKFLQNGKGVRSRRGRRR